MSSKSLNNNTLIIVSLLFVVFSIGSIILVNNLNSKVPKVEIKVERDTIWDTTKIIKPYPIPHIIKEIKRDTIKGDTVLISETKEYNDTLINERDTAIVSTKISGVNAKLDTISVLLKKERIKETNTITITKSEDRKKIHISPQIGFGIGLFNKKPDMYVGFGISYDL